MGGGSGEEFPVLQWIASFLEDCGFEDLHWQEYDPGKWNLYARRGTSPFLIATHVDVHYAGRKRDFIVRDGFVFGAGVLDTRGQIAALLDAVQRTTSPAELVFFSEEETTGAGSWHFEPHRPFEGALVLEPTSFSLCVALAGDVEVRFFIEGLSGHGAYPHAAQNAIHTGHGGGPGMRGYRGFFCPASPLRPSPPPDAGENRGGRVELRYPGALYARMCAPFPASLRC